MGSSIVSDVLASAEWIAKALSSSGYQADFTLTSLGEIDRFFDEHAPVALLDPMVYSRRMLVHEYSLSDPTSAKPFDAS